MIIHFRFAMKMNNDTVYDDRSSALDQREKQPRIAV